MQIKFEGQEHQIDAISKSIEASDADPTVTGLSVNVDDKLTPITFKKEEFHDYIYSDFDSETLMPDEQTEVVETVLTIIGLNFELGSRWQFMFNGFKIPMIVKDGALMPSWHTMFSVLFHAANITN